MKTMCLQIPTIPTPSFYLYLLIILPDSTDNSYKEFIEFKSILMNSPSKQNMPPKYSIIII